MDAALAGRSGHLLGGGDPKVNALVVHAIELFDKAGKAPDRIHVGRVDHFDAHARGHTAVGPVIRIGGCPPDQVEVDHRVVIGLDDECGAPIALNFPAVGNGNESRMILIPNLVQRFRRSWPAA